LTYRGACVIVARKCKDAYEVDQDINSSFTLAKFNDRPTPRGFDILPALNDGDSYS